MNEETNLRTTDPVELLESALAYVVNSERLVKLASDALAQSDPSDSRARIAYRHAINASDRVSSLREKVSLVAAKLEGIIGLKPNE